MKFLVKLLGIAAILGLSLGAAQAGGNAGGNNEREHYYRAPGFHHDCFSQPHHPGCFKRPMKRLHHPRHGSYVQPGIHFEFRFGNVHPRRHYDDYPRQVIRKARFCSNSMAVNKAQAMGVRHIRAYAYRDHILIKGKKRGHRVNIAFSRQWGCPVIDW